ncbi:DegT/DnrJ/EryC1/StrS aminotransferase family protein [Paenibacillus sp. NEAU-GSW1]|uniref:DegT/DnrJ/EryC1/StrS family aminotransferase n=1 Tax=Paenibacillus sp. NEAU-GSW1 TaxID=2682486 RepID=UPI0012E17C68|nr:DegT/DnrJ/EryC1/StrS family aminotransferase [Paenibacillus sp. NEAU-GSW1]MUT68733.1 aminotransferase class I/II-fold pyridoxal phosphate-dependent enzyme [Paenibacillus sp. NEAU-GSW1]
MEGKFYPVAVPVFNGNEKKYVMDCIDSTWISSTGKYITAFEEAFAAFCGARYAVSCSNGTTALHLALLANGVGSGDEVIVPTLTFIATANAVVYCGAKPVFADCEPDTWNMNLEHLESLITPKTKGIIPVHLYGHPADMDAVNALAAKHGLFVIEDAAEALGAEYKGRRTGSLSGCATFSLFGNKIITTGEGGMITTDDEQLAAKMRTLRGQGIDPVRKYWFPVIGYNYRLTNLQAAVGLAQLENIDWHVGERVRVASLYESMLRDESGLTLPVQKDWAKNVYWMFSIVLNGYDEPQRNQFMAMLKQDGIETRPFFYPMHVLPPYEGLQSHEEFPVANRIASQGLNVPTYGGLSEADIQYITGRIKHHLRNE